MKKTEAELTEFFIEKISFIFDNFKKLPHYGQSHPTFVAIPRKSDTFEKIRQTLTELGVTVESLNSMGNAHIIKFDEESRIVILYAKEEKYFEWLYNYNAYSISIVLGKILKSIGLKHGEEGLQYVQYDLRENHKSVVGTFEITRDFYGILDLLELNVERYKQGFSNVTDVIEFLIQSPYFKPEKFINYNKEQTNIFLQKLEEYLILHKFTNDNPKKLTLERVKEFFKHIDFDTEINALAEKAEKKQSIVDKLNGRLILDTIPGFEAKNIGLALSVFKQSFETPVQYKEFMAERTQEEVLSKFKEVNKIL